MKYANLQNNNIGMYGSLVDAEGFPRNDIDVFVVRQARQQIICLQNDHQALMKNIEQLLHELHANAKQVNVSEYLAHNVGNINLNDAKKKPILKVKDVAVGSPAEKAVSRAKKQSQFVCLKHFAKILLTVGNNWKKLLILFVCNVFFYNCICIVFYYRYHFITK